MISLIEQLEQADGPGRELDARIAHAIGRCNTQHYRALISYWKADCWDEEKPVPAPPPPYTGSVDAALSLVPEGHRYRVQFWHHHTGPFGASVRADVFPHGGGSNWVAENCATPALAICIAALKAQSGDEG